MPKYPSKDYEVGFGRPPKGTRFDVPLRISSTRS